MKKVLLSILIILGGSAITYGGELTEISGFCGKDGNNIKWIVNTEDKTLVFEGTGEMQDFQNNDQPWKQYKNDINSVIIHEGVETIGDNAFCEMVLSDIILPSTINKIGVYAFWRCTNLRNVTLPNKITQIGQYAFDESGIEKIDIPKSMQNLEGRVFGFCRNLVDVFIPEGLISIGSGAFCGCSSIIEINLPSSIEIIGSEAFAGCSNLKSINLPEGLYDIGTKAFLNTQLNEVTIPSTVSTLNDYVFGYCKQLTTLSLHDNISQIGNYCFYNCERIKEITIPKECTLVGRLAFAECIALETIVIKSNTCFGDGVFSDCISLSTVEFPEFYDSYNLGNCMFSGCSSLKPLYNNTTFIYMPEEYDETFTFPSGIISIAKYAFYNNKTIKELVLPSSINSIGNYAFAYSTIEEIDFANSESVTIGEGTFQNSSIRNIIGSSRIINCPQYSFTSCNNLEVIDLSGLVNAYGYDEIGEFAFGYCKNLKTVIVGNLPLRIGGAAFINCESLKDFNFTLWGSIGSSAFENCKSLKEINLTHSGAINIGYESFKGCENLKKIEIGRNGIQEFNISSFADCDNLKEIVYNSEYIPNVSYSIYDIYYNVWVGNNTEHSLPYNKSSFKIYGYLADLFLEKDNSFWSRVNLERVYEDLSGECGDKGDNIIWSLNTEEGVLKIVGSGNMKMPEDETTLTWKDRKIAVKEIALSEDIESICSQAFESLPIKTLKLNKNLKEIGHFAFSGCGMESIEFNDSLKKICEWAFGSCYSLRKVVLNEGLEYIENSVFGMCYSLEELILPNSLLSLGQGVTVQCSNLKTIILPKKISSIPNYTFDACNNLRDVYIPSITPPTFGGRNDYNSGLRMNSNVTIHIPQGYTEAYRSAAVWSQHKIDEYYEYITINCNDGGVFVVNNDTIKSGNWDDYLIKGDNLSLKVIPNNYYTVNSLLINGKESISELDDGVLSFNALNESKNIQILFKPNVYNLSIINHGSGNTRIWDYLIDDQAKFKIDYSEKADISFIPNNNCFLESVLINGVEIIDQVKENKYHIEQTTEDMIIEVFFSNVKGDVNADGTINEVDVTEVMNYIMGNQSNDFDNKAADTNDDGVVNIADIIWIANKIIGTKEER